LTTATTAGINTTSGTLTVQDAAGVGFGTLNITSYASTAAAQNTISTLTDTKIANLNFSR
jgi:hypothetical protein